MGAAVLHADSETLACVSNVLARGLQTIRDLKLSFLEVAQSLTKCNRWKLLCRTIQFWKIPEL